MKVTIGSLLELSPERRQQEYWSLAHKAVREFKSQPEHTNHSAILALMGAYKIKLTAYDIAEIEKIAARLR
jgi:hypothetical protein